MMIKFIKHNKMLTFISIFLFIYLSWQATRAPEGFWVRRRISEYKVEQVQLTDIYQSHYKETRQVLPIVMKPQREYKGVFEITAYCPCAECCEKWSYENHGPKYVQKTASGTIPIAGQTIATDWSIIKPGTHVLINGVEYIAEDKGGGIKGNRIDIFFKTHEETEEFGRQIADVYIIY